jgi:hypothetical protein
MNPRWRVGSAYAVVLCLAAGSGLTQTSSAQEAQWIWSPEHAPDDVPPGVACHFRKVFQARSPEAGTIAIAASPPAPLKRSWSSTTSPVI